MNDRRHGARDHLVAPGDPSARAGGPVWPSLGALVTQGEVAGGDRILLAPGRHGAITIVNRRFDPPVEIRSRDPAARAHAPRIEMRNSHGVHVVGIDVWPSDPAGLPDALVSISHGSSGNRLDDLDIRAVADAPERYYDWSLEDWQARRVKGVSMSGADNVLTGSRVTATSFGITTTGPRARVLGNSVTGFSGDALRGLGNDTVFAGNSVRDCVDIDGNHDDGFQAWSPRDGSGPLSGLTIAGNVIREWVGPPDHPLRCRLQGISLFDGAYGDVTIVNNVVAVTAYHGIAVYGGDGTRILHNTVVHGDGAPGGHPWIMLADHDSGRPARDNTVLYNVAMGYKLRTAEVQGLPRAANAAIPYPARALRDVTGGDFRPRPESGLVDAVPGPAQVAVDVMGTPRPVGAAADLGAYEWVCGTAATCPAAP